jgi:hypothetical protein
VVFESRGADILPRAAKWERGRVNYPPTVVEFGFRRMFYDMAYAHLSLSVITEEARKARPPRCAAPSLVSL